MSLTGDRRFGKTSVRHLVEDELRSRGCRVAAVSAQRQTLVDVVEAIIRELRKGLWARP
ncbi:MAG: hypothetical protein V9G19_19135 [Tetrasphaera sp.]